MASYAINLEGKSFFADSLTDEEWLEFAAPSISSYASSEKEDVTRPPEPHPNITTVTCRAVMQNPLADNGVFV